MSKLILEQKTHRISWGLFQRAQLGLRATPRNRDRNLLFRRMKEDYDYD
jgi:hypothetical protein